MKAVDYALEFGRKLRCYKQMVLVTKQQDEMFSCFWISNVHSACRYDRNKYVEHSSTVTNMVQVLICNIEHDI